MSTEPTPLPPNTTLQQDETAIGQRKVNLIWEFTQTVIAVAVVLGGLFMTMLSIGFILALVVLLIYQEVDISVNQLALLSIGITTLNAMNLTLGIVIGFYFSRTNHQAIGGVGAKPTQPYIGR